MQSIAAVEAVFVQVGTEQGKVGKYRRGTEKSMDENY